MLPLNQGDSNIPPNPAYIPPNNQSFQVPTAPSENNGVLSKIIIALVFLVVVISVMGYAYTASLWPFSIKPLYTENNFFSGLLAKSSEINSSSYAASIALTVDKRDPEAQPFVVQVSNTPELREMYQNDSTRAENISFILSLLGYYGTKAQNTTNKKFLPYPTSLKKLAADIASDTTHRYREALVSVDPVTKNEYEYQVTDGGKNFLLSTTFETADAVKAIRDRQTATSTMVNDKKVSFTKDSSPYLYLSPEPPKPLLVELGEMLRMLPPDVRASVMVGASSQWKGGTPSDWLFNFDAAGSFGDLEYKVNADALKKDTDYYFKVNNMPSFLMGELASLKGTWIKMTTDTVSSTASTSSGYGGELSYLSNEFPRYEKDYRENREKFVNLLREAASIADEVQLITFKKAPQQETVEGKKLMRYELSLRKESILPFYMKLADAVLKDGNLKDYAETFNVQGTKEYLQSKEFSDVFDYLDKNIQYVFWTDQQGFPAIVQQSLRIVPPDTAVQLKDKQVDLVLKLVLSKINEPVVIEAPANATPIETVMKQFDHNMYDYDPSGLARLKSNLASIRAEAELIYDANGNSYGKKPFSLGPCAETEGTLFAEKKVSSLIKEAAGGAIAQAMCISKGTTGKVNSYAVSAPLPGNAQYSWCIDSVGSSKQIKGKLKTDTCE